MWTDFEQLWRERERPVRVSRRFVVWLKRALHLPAILSLLLKASIVRHRGAKVGRLVVLGRCRISGDLKNLAIGDESSLGRCQIALHEAVTIGRRVVLNDGVLILTASHSLRDPHWRQKKAPISIGDYAWIASNAIILPGVSIGTGAVVGAGSVVREDVPEYCVVIGNPARMTACKRTTLLDYSPVMLNAPVEAWVGPARHKATGVETL